MEEIVITLLFYIKSRKANIGNVIAYGRNRSPKNNYEALSSCTIHSEYDAIKKLKKKDVAKNKKTKINIFIFKSSKRGHSISNSKPCLKCVNDMYCIPRQLGYKIKNIYYSYDNKTVIKTNLNKLIREAIKPENPLYLSKYYQTYRKKLHNYLCRDFKKVLKEKLLETEEDSHECHHHNCHHHSCEESENTDEDIEG